MACPHVHPAFMILRNPVSGNFENIALYSHLFCACFIGTENDLVCIHWKCVLESKCCHLRFVSSYCPCNHEVLQYERRRVREQSGSSLGAAAVAEGVTAPKRVLSQGPYFADLHQFKSFGCCTSLSLKGQAVSRGMGLCTHGLAGGRDAAVALPAGCSVGLREVIITWGRAQSCTLLVPERNCSALAACCWRGKLVLWQRRNNSSEGFCLCRRRSWLCAWRQVCQKAGTVSQ